MKRTNSVAFVILLSLPFLGEGAVLAGVSSPPNAEEGIGERSEEENRTTLSSEISHAGAYPDLDSSAVWRGIGDWDVRSSLGKAPQTGEEIAQSVIVDHPMRSGKAWYLDFEWGHGQDGQPIASGVPGLRFTTTAGQNWIYGDASTDNYNVTSVNPGLSWGSGCYNMEGYVFAWLGPNQGYGRIDFLNAGPVRAPFTAVELLLEHQHG